MTITEPEVSRIVRPKHRAVDRVAVLEAEAETQAAAYAKLLAQFDELGTAHLALQQADADRSVAVEAIEAALEERTVEKRELCIKATALEAEIAELTAKVSELETIAGSYVAADGGDELIYEAMRHLRPDIGPIDIELAGGWFDDEPDDDEPVDGEATQEFAVMPLAEADLAGTR